MRNINGLDDVAVMREVFAMTSFVQSRIVGLFY